MVRFVEDQTMQTFAFRELQLSLKLLNFFYHYTNTTRVHVKVVIFNPYFPLENEYHAQATPEYSINYSLLHRNLH